MIQRVNDSSGRNSSFMSGTLNLLFQREFLVPPQVQENWTSNGPGGQQVECLLRVIAQVKNKRVTGDHVVFSFASHRIQPLQHRQHPSFRYPSLKGTIKFFYVHPLSRTPTRRSGSSAPTDLYPKSPLCKNQGLKIHLTDLQLHPMAWNICFNALKRPPPSPARRARPSLCRAPRSNLPSPRTHFLPKIGVACSSRRRTPARQP